jgi:D-beta-D-heptose 7-phosphate kinase/D-beta-D-heptose 1-phosphate adenosyltransferase
VTIGLGLPVLTAGRARELIAGFSGASVLVVGDVMLDHFLVGRVDRISPEAPVPIVAFEREEWRIGGAGNVAHNIAALGGRVSLAGVTGADAAADRLAAELRDRRIDPAGLVRDSTRRTTTKMRVVTTRNQQVARIDYETDDEIGGDVERTMLDRAVALGATADAVIVSDYLKGAVTRAVMTALVELRRIRRAPLLVDPKIPHLAYYAGATLVTPNHHEAEIATRRRIRTDADAREAAHALRDQVHTDGVLITRGEHGLWLLDEEFDGPLAATAREVADVTGAGDTVIATLALALAAGATTAEAAGLANQAAGIVVGRFGPATASAEELAAACGA